MHRWQPVLATAQDGKVVRQLPWRLPAAARRFGAPPLMNLKRTYRRASVLLARLLGNLGVAGATPVLGRFAQPAGPEEKRWLRLYLDSPKSGTTYRFFRW
jgi:hypothetical protein